MANGETETVLHGHTLSMIVDEDEAATAAAATEMGRTADGPPLHPVECMQGAFEESMIETTTELGAESSKVHSEKIDSATRRRILLEQEENEETHAARWRQKPGQRFHPLWKLVAQIAFGIHLLDKQLAKSAEAVTKILQGHVDEIDGFLERTTEDFDLAINDINDRLRYLKLPLTHGDVFDGMLEDKEFRTQIIDGNEKIEHIISRTAAGMNDALRDVGQGLAATKELARYVLTVEQGDERSPDLEGVFDAMRGNSEGWYRCFMSLQSKGSSLRAGLVELGNIVAELQKRAGIASRKAIPTIHRPLQAAKSVNYAPETFSPRVNASRRASAMKGLPTAPDSINLATATPPRQESLESKPRPRREARFADDSPSKSPVSGTPSISRGVTQQPREQHPREPSVRSKRSNKSAKSGKSGSLFRPSVKSPQPSSASPNLPFLSAHSGPSQILGKDSSYNSASSVAGSATSGSYSQQEPDGSSTKTAKAPPIFYVSEPEKASNSPTTKSKRPSLDNFPPPLLAPPPPPQNAPQPYSPTTSSKLSLPSTSITSITKFTASDQHSERSRPGVRFFRNPFHRDKTAKPARHAVYDHLSPGGEWIPKKPLPV